LLELEGAPATDSSAALASLAASFGDRSRVAAEQLSAAHAGSRLGAGSEDALLGVIDLVIRLSTRAARLS
jgi:hypothetical protein